MVVVTMKKEEIKICNKNSNTIGSEENLKNKMGIYVVTNMINGKQYVGQSRNILHRWYDHRSKSVNPRRKDEINSLFYRAIREYGIDNFKISILEECKEEELNEKESYWITKLDTFYDGYNNDFGGNLPCYTKEHHMTDHGKAKLTIGDVKMCREAYKNGKRSRDIYEKFFSDKIKWSGFLRMWHGRTWKSVMPEVFNQNPNPSKKVTSEQIKDIRRRYDSGESCYSMANGVYKGILSQTTIYGIATRKTYKDNIHYNSDVSTNCTETIDTSWETGILEKNSSKK